MLTDEDSDDIDSDYDPDEEEFPEGLGFNCGNNSLLIQSEGANTTVEVMPSELANTATQITNNGNSNADMKDLFNIMGTTAANTAMNWLLNKTMGQQGQADDPQLLATFPTLNGVLKDISLAQPQTLLTANPAFLTGGIPNCVLSQLALITTPNGKNSVHQNVDKNQISTTVGTEGSSRGSCINYANRHISTNDYAHQAVHGMHVTAAPDEDGDFEEIGVAETYANYTPCKLRLGCRHPDAVVETASLSSVDPIEPNYKLSLPEEVITGGKLSALQLEAITYACQAHEHKLPDGTRAGFFLGDGAGVGKGRTIAGIIYENFLRGHKRALWVSVSNDLKYDAERDLRDVGASFISVFALNKFKYTKITAQDNQCKRGVIFCTYAALIGESNMTTGKYRSRVKQLLQWCGHDFEGLVIFDECHKAKNLSWVNAAKSTKTGTTVFELQQKLPSARIVYVSATGASEPRNMAYMVRLGLCGDGTAFPTFGEFLTAVEMRGVGAMEIVAMDMKLRGMYIARQLSFKDVSFRIEEVPLTAEFRRMYNQSVDLWVDAMAMFTKAANLIGTDKRTYKVLWCQFWCAHQRFFKYLCIASKVEYAVKSARAAIKHGKCVVIGLQSTGESRTLDQLDRDDGTLQDFVSTARNIFLSFVEKNFPAPERERYNHLLLTGNIVSAEHLAHSNAKAAASSNTSNHNTGHVKRFKKRRSTNLYSDDDSDLELSDSESELDESNMPDSDSEDDAPHQRPQDKAKTGQKRPRGRPRKINKINKGKSLAGCLPLLSTWPDELHYLVGKQTVQDRILELLQQKLDVKETQYVCQTDENGMPLHRLESDIRARETLEKEIENAICMRETLIRKVEVLGRSLPPNTLDHLIDELGGPENVAEMTGRRGRVVQTHDGRIHYESRCEDDIPMETINIIEKQRFMNGEKDVAIISEAASSGISLQSDRRCQNQRRRVHITLELPWSADRAVQQFGRTHRSNQVNAPQYIFLISDLAGERRFAATVAKRLESLGALTQGDRRATDTRDLSQFNIDNKYGRAALEAVMKAIAGEAPPVVPPPKNYKSNFGGGGGGSADSFFKDCTEALVGVGLLYRSEDFPGVVTLDKDYNNISKFLNRILGCHVDLQNALFKYLNDTMTHIISQMKRTGRFDMGILDLGAHGEDVALVSLVRFLRRHATGVAPTELHTVTVARGMPWNDAVDKYATLTKSYEGFYITKHERVGKRGVVLAVEEETPNKSTYQSNKEKAEDDIKLRVYRPNTGVQVRIETLTNIENRYTKCTSTEAEPYWQHLYNISTSSCTHVYWLGQCRLGNECQVGLRDRVYHVLSGLVLPIWTRVERILNAQITNSKMQVIRMKTTSGKKIVGTMIPKACYETLLADLKADSEKVQEFKY